MCDLGISEKSSNTGNTCTLYIHLRLGRVVLIGDIGPAPLLGCLRMLPYVCAYVSVERGKM